MKLFILAVLALFAVTAVLAQEFPNTELVEFDETRDITEPFKFPEFDTPKEYLNHYFSGDSPAKQRELLDLVMAAAKADNHPNLHRAAQVQVTFSMSVEEFDSEYDTYRFALMKLANQVDVPYTMFHTSYAELLAQVSAKILTQPDLVDIFMECDAHRDLFQFSITLLSHEEEFTMLRSIVYLDKPITWAFNKIRSSKCSWCTKLFQAIKSKSCSKASEYICDAIITAITEGAAAPFASKICGAPIKLSSFLSKVCVKIANYVGKKTGLSSKGVCQHISFGTFTIPAHHGAIVHYDRHSLTIGSLC